MKKLLILSTALLVFAACGGKDDAATGSEEAAPQDNRSAEEFDALIEENVKVAAEASNEQDPDLCNKIEDPNMRGSCLYNIYVNQALHTGDASLCEKILDDALIKNCKNMLIDSE